MTDELKNYQPTIDALHEQASALGEEDRESGPVVERLASIDRRYSQVMCQFQNSNSGVLFFLSRSYFFYNFSKFFLTKRQHILRTKVLISQHILRTKVLISTICRYKELLEMAKIRKQRLLDALSLYKLFTEADGVEQWIAEKEKMLHTMVIHSLIQIFFYAD